jgi:hypothetical protein
MGYLFFLNLFNMIAKNQVFKKKLDDEGNPIIVDGEFVMELVSEEEVEMIVEPNWRKLTEDLYASPLMFKALTEANPNAFAVLLKVLTDGENGNSTENTLLGSIQMCGINFSDEEKQALNQILKDNFFSVEI